MDFVNVSPTRIYLSYCRFIELQIILSYHVGEKFQKKSLLLLFLFLLLPSKPLFLSIFLFTFLYAYYYLFHVQFFRLTQSLYPSLLHSHSYSYSIHLPTLTFPNLSFIGVDIVAFQCRNPIHRAHYELFTRALDDPILRPGAVVRMYN